MGSGFKDFAPGGILTAADVDGYLMRQGVMTFASEAARDAALSGVLDEGMVTYQEDTNQLTYHNGASWRVIYRARTSHTPTASGALTAGNGTYDVEYSRHGDAVFLGGSFTFGTTSTMGSGQPTFSLPISANSPNVRGVANLSDTSTGFVYPATCRLASAATVEIRRCDSGVTSTFTSSTPFTWANTDLIDFAITYFAA